MKRKNFTLVELLVIIGIMGITAAMLAPMAERGTSPQARTINCRNNVKQFAIALKVYACAYDETFPTITERFSSLKKTAPRNVDSTNSVACLELLRSGNFLMDYKVYICPNSTGQAGAKDINNGVLTNDAAKTGGTRQVTYVYFEGLTEAADSDTGMLSDGFGGVEGETERWNHDNYGNFVTVAGYTPNIDASKMWVNEVKAGPGQFTDGVDSSQAKKSFHYVNGGLWTTD